MALRVPRIEMQHEALAVWLRRVELRIGLARRSKRVLPLTAAAQTKRVVDGMSGFVPEDAHAPLVFAAFDLEHLGFLQLLEARVGQIERDGDRRPTIRCEPFIRQIETQRKAQVARRVRREAGRSGRRAYSSMATGKSDMRMSSSSSSLRFGQPSRNCARAMK